jgi:hypothetical protein
MSEIDIGLVNYSLKCISGIYKNMSLPISFSTEGEIIGCKDRDEVSIESELKA